MDDFHDVWQISPWAPSVHKIIRKHVSSFKKKFTEFMFPNLNTNYMNQSKSLPVKVFQMTVRWMLKTNMEVAENSCKGPPWVWLKKRIEVIMNKSKEFVPQREFMARRLQQRYMIWVVWSNTLCSSVIVPNCILLYTRISLKSKFIALDKDLSNMFRCKICSDTIGSSYVGLQFAANCHKSRSTKMKKI